MKLTQNQQNDIIQHISECFRDYDRQSQSWRSRMERIYKSVNSFETEAVEGETRFKVNKAHEIENKILPRIIANNPKPIVSYKADDYIEDEDINQSLESRTLRAKAIQDRLHKTYMEQDMVESLKIVAKSGIRYWLWIAKIKTSYKIKRTPKKVEQYDDLWTYTEKQVDEEVYDYYATIEAKSRADLYFDPRYVRLEELPSIIELKRNVRLSYFSQSPNKSKYMNLKEVVNLASSYGNENEYKNRMQQLLGMTYSGQKLIKPDSIDLKCYYWYFDLSDKDDMSNEKLYEFWTINDTVIIYANEISYMPFEDFKVFEDVEQFYPTWFIEPTLGLQDELNFKKNKSSMFINQALNRNRLRSPNSWVDPRKLVSKPWNIIPVQGTVTQALENLQELPMRNIPYDYFQEQNDIDRQIQSWSFTIDTSSQRSTQALTNTATWIKVQDRDTSFVIDWVRGNFENFVSRLSYKLLQAEFDVIDENIRVKKVWEEGFREINKEAMKDALEKYSIKVESWSSSYDNIENRRADAIARMNLAMQMHQAGLPVNLKEQYIEVMETFEGVDTSKLFEESPMWLPEMSWMGQIIPPESEKPISMSNPTNTLPQNSLL